MCRCVNNRVAAQPAPLRDENSFAEDQLREPDKEYDGAKNDNEKPPDTLRAAKDNCVQKAGQ